MSFGMAAMVALPILSNPVNAATLGQHPTTQWAYPGPDGKLPHKTTPAGDRIMDFSHAGYMGGGVALPNVPPKRTVRRSGVGDDTAGIQAAINEVAALPLEGRWLINDRLTNPGSAAEGLLICQQ